MLKKRRHTRKEKGDQKGRISNIVISIFCQNPHVSFSQINFGFLLDFASVKVITMCEVKMCHERNPRQLLLIHVIELDTPYSSKSQGKTEVLLKRFKRIMVTVGGTQLNLDV